MPFPGSSGKCVLFGSSTGRFLPDSSRLHQREERPKGPVALFRRPGNCVLLASRMPPARTGNHAARDDLTLRSVGPCRSRFSPPLVRLPSIGQSGLCSRLADTTRLQRPRDERLWSVRFRLPDGCLRLKAETDLRPLAWMLRIPSLQTSSHGMAVKGGSSGERLLSIRSPGVPFQIRADCCSKKKGLQGLTTSLHLVLRGNGYTEKETPNGP